METESRLLSDDCVETAGTPAAASDAGAAPRLPKGRLAFIGACLFLLMLPVTALVPVLHEMTVGRFPGLSDFEKHLFMTANMLGAALFAPVAGLVSDWMQRRKPLLVAAFVVNALSLWLMLPGYGGYPVQLGLRFVEGCAHIAAFSMLLTLGMDLSGRSEPGKVMGFLGCCLTLGVATGAPLGGVMGKGDPLLILKAGGLLMGAIAVACAVVLQESLIRRAGVKLRELVATLGECRLLWVPYVFMFLDRLTVGFIVSTMTLYLRAEMEAPPQKIGAIMALFMIPFALLTYPAGRLSRRFNKLGMMIVGSLVYGATFFVFPFATLGQISLLMFVSGMSAALMFAPSLVLVQLLAGEKHRAIAMSGFTTAGAIGFLLGPLFGGALVSASGYRGAFLATGLVEVLCALVFIGMLRRVRV